MVVVSLIAILSLAVGLTAGGAFGPRGVAAGERLVQADARARDAALLGRTLTGLVPRGDGWLLVRRAGDLWQREGAALRLTGATLVWEIDGHAYLPGLLDPGAGAAPPVQFAPDGGSTPFAVTLVQGRDRRLCRAAFGEALACE